MNAAEKAERQIERFYMKRKRRRVTYTACEELNFHWDIDEVKQVEHMWKQGLSIWDIAKAFKRDVDEVAILIMDRSRQGAIKWRRHGAYGRRKQYDPDYCPGTAGPCCKDDAAIQVDEQTGGAVPCLQKQRRLGSKAGKG